MTLKRITLVLLFLSLFLIQPKEVEASSLDINFASVNLFSDVYALIGNAAWNPDKDFLILEIPLTNSTIFTRGGEDSYINFTDSITSLPDIRINFEDLVAGDPESTDILKGIFVIDLTPYNIVDHGTISIILMQSYSSTPGGYVAWFNNLFQATTDTSELNTARFYVQGVLYHETIFFRFVTNLPEPPPNPPNRFFTVWFTSNGQELNTEQIYTTDLIIYAGFERQLTGVPPVPPPMTEIDGPDGLANLLLFSGFLNNTGFIIFYTAVILIVAIGLLWFRIRGLFIIISLTAITATFLVMGLLPIYASFILVLAFALGILNSIKGGGGAISE